ncbi:receptor L domain-containing protein [Phthorimaea operculella]|nr:receptor L domain-containing protein [Phthorimaea operculella]
MAAAAKATLIGFLMILCCAMSQRLEAGTSSNSSGICLSVQVYYNTMQRLRGCVVIVGNLRFISSGRDTNVFNESFPELREVTGYVLLHRLAKLESFSQLFPNLVRIRGRQLINNYALVVNDVPDLKEVTGYVLLHRLAKLESFSQLFPNLVRIRGRQLINNYALVVNDVPDLKEVTGYVLLHRLAKLESFSQLFPNLVRIRGRQLINNYALGPDQLFPNLVRIRGRQLINNYALVVNDVPDLKEVTGYVLLHRLAKLESFSQLFPNLVRIRGRQLINNDALVVNDVPDLKEVGLYNLLKIDRGGVVIWGRPHTCYVDTVDWNAIAPNSKHMLTYPDMKVLCHSVKPCKCGPKGRNHCWNSRRCQKFDQGTSCHPECLGCTQDRDVCYACRHYTHRGRCVSHCPPETILLPDNQYCITADECKSLSGGFVWNQTCLFDCPIGYEKFEHDDTFTCGECIIKNCGKVCGSLTINSLSGIQKADGCVRINGSLTIHVFPVPGAIEELKKHMKYIETVTDYVYIYSSSNITSLDFLSNLKQIAGRKLIDNSYSLVIHDMRNLRELFPPKVMKDLQIDRGKLKIFNNPKLCMDKIIELEEKFVVKSNETDVPPGLNGYTGDCDDFGLRVQKENETTVTILFSPKNDSNINHYTVLFAKVPAESQMGFVPELCSKSEWSTIHSDEGRVSLTSLHPASTYAVCIEISVYSEMPLRSFLARSPIVYFTMPFVKPEPPFILEIVSTSPNAIHLQWVDHRDYRRHVTSYQLELTLIDIPSKDVTLRDHCNANLYEYAKEEYSRHVLVFRPPVEYKSCETNCRTIIPLRERFSLAEEHFDVCNSLGSDCDAYEEPPTQNSSIKHYVKTLALNIPGSEKTFRVEGLAPFRDYKIRLRSCAKDKCSRSTRAVIRTLRSNKADIPSITSASIDGNRSIYVQWEAAEETNGPVLMYFVQVLPDEITTANTLVTSWCVYPDERSLIAESQVHKEFKVRVCSSTLGSFSACSEWKHIVIPEVGYNLYLWAIAFSIAMTAVSVGISAIYFKRQNDQNEVVPLVDMTSLYRNESEPPVLSSDFMPFYSVPLNDALD